MFHCSGGVYDSDVFHYESFALYSCKKRSSFNNRCDKNTKKKVAREDRRVKYVFGSVCLIFFLDLEIYCMKGFYKI